MHSVLLCWFPYCSFFPLHWPSPTPFQSVSLTFAVAKLIREHLLRHSHPAALGIPNPRCYCLPLYQIQRLLPNCLHSHSDYPCPHCSLANFRCPKCFQVCYPHHFWLDDHWFFWFRGHLISEFVLQGGPLQTKLVAKVIFLRIEMQPHHYVETVTRMLWQSLPCSKCILWLSSACFECEVPSV